LLGLPDNLGMTDYADFDENPNVAAVLAVTLARAIQGSRFTDPATGAQGGWLPFDEFMQMALYTPRMGYYASSLPKIGADVAHTDFTTAPEISPVFAQCLAEQIAQGLAASGTDEIWEFGAGTGALAAQLIAALAAKGVALKRYTIVDISSHLRGVQQERLAAHGSLVQWASSLPPQMQGVVVGNELLDAMPVKLLQRTGGVWHERGVGLDAVHDEDFVWVDRPTALRPPLEIEGGHDYLTEIHPQAEAFVRTLASHLVKGVALLVDYGFPEAEYYHPQRHMGTLMCHRAHHSDPNPLDAVGLKDITAHVNFTGIALAAQDASMDVLGYTTQGRFLMNCNALTFLEQETAVSRRHSAKLLQEHEMGELFKVIALAKGLGTGVDFEPMGFSEGDRSHTL
jgi:SAM-dependent MidA family methyltransferase